MLFFRDGYVLKITIYFIEYYLRQRVMENRIVIHC